MRKTLLFVVTMLCTAVQSYAAMLTYDLTDLVGQYTLTDLTSASDTLHVQVVNTSINASLVDRVTLYATGTITAGVFQGDGVLRPHEPYTIPGLLAMSVFTTWTGDGTWIEPLESDQLHDESWTVNGPFNNPLLMPSLDPPSISPEFSPTIHFVLSQGFMAPNIPWLTERDPNDYYYTGWEGLDAVTPITLTITEAYMVVEARVVPEPATLSLMTIAVISALHRSRRRA
ncbi:MAG: PEP-CTERM sorting domain-containing protein [Phycisphaeraceae bacterium]|nr:PEP-CTERM sorting domain-containing protein [Phycisphaeraceae bacterium]